MPVAAEHITGLILAGGQGSRMEHRDKGLQTLHGLPLVSHVIARLQPQVHTLAINANRNADTYASFGLPVWSDEITGFAGPLAGLHSGLSHCRSAYLATVPCDSPLLPADLVARLAAALEQDQADAAIAVTRGSTLNGAADARLQRQPVFCLLKRELLGRLDDYLRQGGRKMEHWFATIHTAQASFDDEFAFSNINTLHELQQLELLKQPDISK